MQHGIVACVLILGGIGCRNLREICIGKSVSLHRDDVLYCMCVSCGVLSGINSDNIWLIQHMEISIDLMVWQVRKLCEHV